MRPLGMLLLMLLTGPVFAADPLFAAEKLFDLKKAADGVYLAVARPQTRINSNAAVIVLEDGVLIVATGDLLQGRMPYMGDSHPFEWIRTLGALEKLDFETLLPATATFSRGNSGCGRGRNT